MLKPKDLLSKMRSEPVGYDTPQLKEQWRFSKHWLVSFAIIFGLVGAYFVFISLAGQPAYKETAFSTDPGWEGYNNRPDGKVACRQISNDFGYSPETSYAGTGGAEIGGSLVDSLKFRAYYAKSIQESSFNDKLSASGMINVTKESGTAGFFGWFNSKSSIGFRPSNVIGFIIDGESREGYRLGAVTGSNNYLVGGTKYSHFLTLGQRYYWTLDYYPDQGSTKNGLVRISVDSETLEFSLPANDRSDGATFDRFGLQNLQVDKDSTPLEVYIDNLQVNGINEGFDTPPRDPGWEGYNNRASGTDCLVHGRPNFGYSQTSFAGGSSGEIGGTLWRSTKRDESGTEIGVRSWYADKTQTLGLNDYLYAKGKIRLTQATVDSDAMIGWFNENSKLISGQPAPTNSLVFIIGGLSRNGYRLYPSYGTAASFGTYDANSNPPQINPRGSTRTFSFCYVPNFDSAGNGQAVFKLSPDNELGIPANQAVLKIPKADIKTKAAFNRFGLRNFEVGGNSIEVYLDDLRYTVAPGDTPPSEDCGTQKYNFSGVVFNDLNNNGKIDGSDARLANESVYLQKPDGTNLSTATTNANGEYKFESLEKGLYRLTHYVSSGYARTTDDSRVMELPKDTSWDFGIRTIEQVDGVPQPNTSPSSPPSPPTHYDNPSGTTLYAGGIIFKGEYLLSSNGKSSLVLQADGNLSIYLNFQLLWETGALRPKADKAIMQPDGNFVIYDNNRRALWATGTDGHPGARLVMQNDGNVVVYNSSNRALWASYTFHPSNSVAHIMSPGFGGFAKMLPGQSIISPDQRFKLVLQTDGNLVLYSPTKALWATGTDGRPVSFLALQPDGNLVLYDHNISPIWASYTTRFGRTRLIIQPDGNLVLYDQSNRPRWNTETAGAT